MLEKSEIMLLENIQKSVDEAKADVKTTKEILTGNGHPEKGLCARTYILEEQAHDFDIRIGTANQTALNALETAKGNKVDTLPEALEKVAETSSKALKSGILKAFWAKWGKHIKPWLLVSGASAATITIPKFLRWLADILEKIGNGSIPQ